MISIFYHARHKLTVDFDMFLISGIRNSEFLYVELAKSLEQ